MLLVAIAIIAGILLAMFSVADVTGDDDERVPLARRDPQAAGRPTSPEVVSDNPARFLGSSITVAGRVTEVVSEAVFVLDDDLLVVARHATGIAVEPQDRVRVRGKVQGFSSIGPTLDVDLRESRFNEWEDGPALVATWIRRDE